MPKAENEMTKTEILQIRVTPVTKMKLDYKKGSKTQTEALNEALSMYLKDDNNLLKQITEDVTFTIKNKEDYTQLRQLYLNSQSLYSDFSRFENNHTNSKTNVWKNIFRDFLLPSIERPIAKYETTHKVEDPLTE